MTAHRRGREDADLPPGSVELSVVYHHRSRCEREYHVGSGPLHRNRSGGRRRPGVEDQAGGSDTGQDGEDEHRSSEDGRPLGGSRFGSRQCPRLAERVLRSTLPVAGRDRSNPVPGRLVSHVDRDDEQVLVPTVEPGQRSAYVTVGRNRVQHEEADTSVDDDVRRGIVGGRRDGNVAEPPISLQFRVEVGCQRRPIAPSVFTLDGRLPLHDEFLDGTGKQTACERQSGPDWMA